EAEHPKIETVARGVAGGAVVFERNAPQRGIGLGNAGLGRCGRTIGAGKNEGEAERKPASNVLHGGNLQSDATYIWSPGGFGQTRAGRSVTGLTPQSSFR